MPRPRVRPEPEPEPEQQPAERMELVAVELKNAHRTSRGTGPGVLELPLEEADWLVRHGYAVRIACELNASWPPRARPRSHRRAGGCAAARL